MSLDGQFCGETLYTYSKTPPLHVHPRFFPTFAMV